MLNGSAVPYFPFTPQPAGDGWWLQDPLSGEIKEINSSAYWLLRLCDGSRTWDEIAGELAQAYHIDRADVIKKSSGILQQLTDAGLVWWRSRPMTWWKLPPPASVLWDFTNQCNLACRHCAVSGGSPAGREFSTAECLRVIDELAGFGVRELVFSGGEPLMRRDFFRLAQHTRDAGMALQVATNATLITQEKARRLAKLASHIQVSIDGATAETHDRFRGVPGAWQRATRGLRFLVETGLPVTVGSVVTTANLAEIPALYEMAASYGARTFRLIPFIPYGRGGLDRALEISPAQMRAVSELLVQKRNHPISVSQLEFECTFYPPPESPLDCASRVGCDGAVNYCTITAGGQVLTCHFFTGVEAENLRDHSFEWIWQNSRFLNYFRSVTTADIQGTCRSCPWLPACRTSCLAASFVHQKMFQSNVHCWLVENAAQMQHGLELAGAAARD